MNIMLLMRLFCINMIDLYHFGIFTRLEIAEPGIFVPLSSDAWFVCGNLAKEVGGVR